jgi:two-component system, NarL family, nitrate/nitrite response regulator NarL
MPETDASVPRRVVVVAEDPLVQSGLSSLLARDPRLEVVDELSPRDDFGPQLSAVSADVAVWDLGSTAAIAERVSAAIGAAPLVCLVADETQVRELMALGVRGLLRREVDALRLCAAVSAVADGLVALDDTLAEELLEERRATPRAGVETLTPRELEVLELVAEGLSNKLIAARLDISEHTAKFHVTTIMTKLGVQSRTEAVVRAARLGLLSL